ncbi:ankyrin repeat domain-containing protein [Candidatus Bathyarchaeota archaeon]|nr:MAG: ankyrin repeat domain-containing protein [Candidatus Bathyarchaeota archaeon]
MLSMQTDEFLDAIQKGNLSKIDQLLATNPALASSKAKNGVSAILLALYYGHQDIAQAIAAKKGGLDIFEASVPGKLERLKNLIEQDRALVETYSPDGFTPVALATYLGQKSVTEYLIEKGANVNAIAKNATGFTALTGAVANNHVEISKILVKRGANVNHRYEGGVSPLMEACLNGNLELVNFLLENGADPSAKTKDEKTPLVRQREESW